MGSRYRRHLKGAVASSAGPYGYTLTIWTTGAVASHEEGIPDTPEALLFLGGAVAAFLAVGLLAYGRPARIVAPPEEGPVHLLGAFHVPSVGAALLLATLIAHLVHGAAVWPLVAFASTAGYLAVLAAQWTIAEARRRDAITDG